MRLFLLSTILLIFSACTVTSSEETEYEVLPINTENEEVTVEVTPIATIETNKISQDTQYHPHSIPALKELVLEGKDFTLGRILADNANYTRYYITYKSNEDLTISGIMNIPKGEGPFPVIILNHGYIDPAVYTNGRGLKREQDYFAKNGYAVVHPDYRGHADSDTPAEELYSSSQRLAYAGYTVDVMNAVVALKNANIPNINVNKIGMMGHSMGGGITMNTIVAKPDLIQAASLYAPVSSDYKDNFQKWSKNRFSEEELIELENNFGPLDQTESWADFSAQTFFNDVQVPVILHHGTEDESTPVEWAYNIQEQMALAGKDIIYKEYVGEKHELIPQWNTFMQNNLDFFDEHLK